MGASKMALLTSQIAAETVLPNGRTRSEHHLEHRSKHQLTSDTTDFYGARHVAGDLLEFIYRGFRNRLSLCAQCLYKIVQSGNPYEV